MRAASTSRSTFLIAAAALAAATEARVQAQVAKPLRLISFFSTTTLPIWAAQAQGYFTREGIALALVQAPGSAEAFVRLSAGDVDLITAAVDNMIAYDEGQGDAKLPNPPDFVAIMGADSGSLELYARPEVTSYADLRGKTLPVDAVGSGYSLLLRQMLENRGLRVDDYRLEAVGGSPQRLAKLQSAPLYAATLLSAPYDIQARQAGYKLLGTGKDGAAAYQASATVARRAWLAGNADLAIGYIRAILSGLDWIFDPRNRSAATALLAERLKLAPEVAGEVFPGVVDPANGLFRDGRINAAGMATVLMLRGKFGVPKLTLSDPKKYYDERYYLQAARGRA
jgi:ABC-type nitrate/sulfonate/bicarbonate transport system substrate-binding protein